MVYPAAEIARVWGEGDRRKISYESFISLAASASVHARVCVCVCVSFARAASTPMLGGERERETRTSLPPLSLSLPVSYALEKLLFLLGHNYPFSLRWWGYRPRNSNFPSTSKFLVRFPFKYFVIDR